jgi:hypothetical protein
LVEHSTDTRTVRGSNPLSRTKTKKKHKFHQKFYCGTKLEKRFLFYLTKRERGVIISFQLSEGDQQMTRLVFGISSLAFTVVGTILTVKFPQAISLSEFLPSIGAACLGIGGALSTRA